MGEDASSFSEAAVIHVFRDVLKTIQQEKLHAKAQEHLSSNPVF